VLQDLADRLIVAVRTLNLETAHTSRIAVLVTQLRGVLDDIARETGGRQPAPLLRALLVDYARANAATYRLDEASAVAETEALLAELKLL
jgi:hypothetical protein